LKILKPLTAKIKSIKFDLENQEVLVESSVPTLELLRRMEGTGKTVHVSGQGKGIKFLPNF
jgi:hypothetical protein